jgi:hypothetical protein
MATQDLSSVLIASVGGTFFYMFLSCVFECIQVQTKRVASCSGTRGKHMLCEKTGGKALSTPLRTIYYVVYAHTRLCTMRLLQCPRTRSYSNFGSLLPLCEL